MSANSSADGSLFALFQCGLSSTSVHMYAAFTITNGVLLFPLCIFVLSLGFQRWTQRRSASSAAAIRFCDFCTYNMAVMELIGVFGYTLGLCCLYAGLLKMSWVGLCIGGFPWSGQMLFPMLACVERYLAVVHPITYLRLRKGGGVHIRNISVLYIWLQCFGLQACINLYVNYPNFNLIFSTCHMVISLIAMTFCSLSVIRVLSRPRPGVASGDRLQVDQSKRRAFNTILIIMGVLLLRFGGNLVCNVVASSPNVSAGVHCSMVAAIGWFNLPSSLVLPLLFLHRAGKLPGWKHNSDSG